ncbi:MAG TPA: Holliday junction branch migration protein RuvA [Spirochaetia bacterium]|nr:Holliday junction branch migration protein RuvA [Spirochaetia bacterium]
MINSIRGEVSEKRAGIIRILTGGIEWDIETSAGSLTSFPDPGEQARAFIYLHHRDDQMRLFGFATEKERNAFLDLLKVSGIGPRQAVKILSRVNLERLVASIDAGDTDALAAVPGVGPKTAGKIVLTLKGKLFLGFRGAAASEDATELVNGLVEMGFDRRKAADAVHEVISTLRASGLTGDELERETLRQSIVRLA